MQEGVLSQEPQKQTICVQSDRGFQGFSDPWQGGSSVSPDSKAGVLLDGGAASLYGPWLLQGCAQREINTHLPASLPRDLVSPLCVFAADLLSRSDVAILQPASDRGLQLC